MTTEYTPLSPTEIAELRVKAIQGELSLEDCRRFIATTRAAFLSRPATKPEKKPKAPAAKKPAKEKKAAEPATSQADPAQLPLPFF